MPFVTITLQRSDFRTVIGEDVDFFADIAIRLGKANSYEDAEDIEELEFEIDTDEVSSS